MRPSTYSLPNVLRLQQAGSSRAAIDIVAVAGIVITTGTARHNLPKLLVFLVELVVVVAINVAIARARNGVDRALALLEPAGGDFGGIWTTWVTMLAELRVMNSHRGR